MPNIEDISKKFTPIYFFGVIFMLLMFYIMFNGLVSNHNVKDLKNQINTIQENVDGIYKENEKIDKKIDGFKSVIIQIDKDITKNNTKIDNLKQYEKDTKDSFRTYDANMWERYFADRYANKD
jgi:septal ring factor EnvC (AmiA/AmiB activator)